MLEFLSDLYSKGGIVLYLITFLSIIGLAIFLERLSALRQDKVIPQTLLERVIQLVGEKKFDEAIQTCTLQRANVARLITEILRNHNWNKVDLRAHVEDIGRQETEKLSKHVGILGTIASICPLLGLLGTVYGMIHTFSVIETQGVGQASQLAGGISMALYTTAAGLTVAIPALIAFKFCNSKVQDLASGMEDYSLRIMEKI